MTTHPHDAYAPCGPIGTPRPWEPPHALEHCIAQLLLGDAESGRLMRRKVDKAETWPDLAPARRMPRPWSAARRAAHEAKAREVGT